MYHFINNLRDKIFLLQSLVKEKDFQLNSTGGTKRIIFFHLPFPLMETTIYATGEQNIVQFILYFTVYVVHVTRKKNYC